ncbi:MAG: hypothetical protein ACYCV7_12455, partial [Acidimicrobiales bacterium]
NGNVSVSNFPKTQAVNGTVNVGNQQAPTKYATASGSNGGTYSVLAPPPAGEAYHLGLVTIDVGCNIQYATGDTLATTGANGGQLAQVIIPQQGTSVLPFGGLTLGAGQGMTFSTNANSGSCWNVDVNYWLSPIR